MIIQDEPTLSRYLAYVLNETKYTSIEERDDMVNKIEVFVQLWLNDNSLDLSEYGLDKLYDKYIKEV